MKRPKLIEICFLCLLSMVFVSWTTHASGQAKTAADVQKEAEQYMPLCKGDQWQKMDPEAKVAFLWGAAHIILIEGVLMEEIPELRVENFSEKIIEARQARVKAGTAMTINQIISTIDQYYKANPDKLTYPVLRVIWDGWIVPQLKTGIAGRPLNK